MNNVSEKCVGGNNRNHRILAENCRWKTHKKTLDPAQHCPPVRCLKTFETPAITINKLLVRPDREKE